MRAAASVRCALHAADATPPPATRVSRLRAETVTIAPPLYPHAASDLDRRDLVRPRERPGAHVQRDRRARPALQPGPRARRRPDRLPEDLQERGRARPGRRDRQGVRAHEGQARRPRPTRTSRPSRPRASRRSTSPTSFRTRRSTRSTSSGRTTSGRRTAPRRSTRSSARRWSRRGSPAIAQVRDARAPAPRLPARARGRDHAREDVLPRRDPAARRHRAAQGQGREGGARDGDGADRAVHELVRAEEVRGHLPRGAAARSSRPSRRARPSSAAPVEEEEEPADLLAALKASVEAAKSRSTSSRRKKAPARKRGAPARKPTARKKTARR